MITITLLIANIKIHGDKLGELKSRYVKIMSGPLSHFTLLDW